MLISTLGAPTELPDPQKEPSQLHLGFGEILVIIVLGVLIFGLAARFISKQIRKGWEEGSTKK